VQSGLRLISLAALLALAAGCSHSGDPEKPEPGLTRVFTPQLPTFLSGSMAVLLTNATGFSSRLDGKSEMLTERQDPLTGQLFGRGSKLLFAPEPGQAADKHARIGGFSFIWDTANHSGYVLCEALQAYAPVSFAVFVTNVTVQGPPSSPISFGGHPCQTAEATVQMSDGTSTAYTLLRANDLAGFPLQVTSGTNAIPLTLSLSKVRLQVPPAELFAPPDGFTKYSSAEALVDELAARQHNLRRRAPELPLEPAEAPGAAPPRRY
jgi:hypothetical protein